MNSTDATASPSYSSAPSQIIGSMSQIYGRSLTQDAQNQTAAAVNGGISGQQVHGDVKFAEDGSTLLLPPGTKLTAKEICS